LIDSCQTTLEQWNQNVRPGVVLGAGPTIGKLVDLPGVVVAGTPRQAVARIQKDLREFQEKNKLDQIIVVNASSTEPVFTTDDRHSTIAKFTAALDQPDLIPASSMYAWAALELGVPYVNFTPSLGASFPAALELCEQKKTCTTGKDGKTGETLMKTVLAPMFKHRHLEILSWVGHNIFGNRDGIILDDPVNKASKIQTKDQVISGIVGYKPNTLVTIEYIPSLDDWKTAWNHIHYRGFLNTKMILQFIWQGCDSILAAPLLARRGPLHAACPAPRRDGDASAAGVLLQKPVWATTITIFSCSTPSSKRTRRSAKLLAKGAAASGAGKTCKNRTPSPGGNASASVQGRKHFHCFYEAIC